jgi:hypothetical protein
MLRPRLLRPESEVYVNAWPGAGVPALRRILRSPWPISMTLTASPDPADLHQRRKAAQGVEPGADFEALRQELIQGFSRLTAPGPTGGSVIERPQREDIYRGPQVSRPRTCPPGQAGLRSRAQNCGVCSPGKPPGCTYDDAFLHVRTALPSSDVRSWTLHMLWRMSLPHLICRPVAWADGGGRAARRECGESQDFPHAPPITGRIPMTAAIRQTASPNDSTRQWGSWSSSPPGPARRSSP